MFKFYIPKLKWLRTVSLSIFVVLAGTLWSYGQTTYYSKAAATNFANTASWGDQPDGSGASPVSISNADNYVIQNGSAMTLIATASVRTLVINAGSLSVSANTLNVSLPTGNTSTLTVNSGGTLTVSGGTINVNGQFQVLGTAAFNQSGGNINVDGNDAGNAATSVAAGQAIINFTSSNLNLTGGTLTCVDPHANTTLSSAFAYNSGVAYNSGSGHTFRFGNGVSTDAGGNAAGFRHDTWTSSGRFLFGNVVVDALTGTNRHITSAWSHGMASLTINSGEYRTTSTPCAIAGNITVNAAGILTANSTIQLSTFLSGVSAPTTNAQTISGTGVFRNSNTTPTANFTSLTVNNTNSAGVTFSGANSVLSGSNTGTVSGTLTFTNGTITSANPFILGISTSTVGTLTATNGGFTSGTPFRRWVSTTTITLSATAFTDFFPFVTTIGSNRYVRLNRNTGATNTAGWVQATHTDVAGLTADAFADGTYNVHQRTNASWAFSTGGGFSVIGTLNVGLSGDGLIVTAAAPGAAPRLIQVGAAAGTHLAGSGTFAAPFANRSLTFAAFTATSHYIGINNTDLGLYSIASGPWTSGATWSTGNVPTAADNVLVSAGTTVTVSAASTALTVAVNGTLSVTGGTLTIVGASGTGIIVGAPGTLSIAGGTVDVGPQDNSFCNRTVSADGIINVSSGALNIAGNLITNGNGGITQSGGNIRVDGNAAGVAGNSVPSGVSIVTFNSANHNLSGGTFTIVDPHANATASESFRYNSGTMYNSESTHTMRFGDGVSTDAGGNATNGFRTNTWVLSGRFLFGNLTVDMNGGTNRYITHVYSHGIRGNFTINSGSEYRANVFVLVAGNFTNNGTFASNSTLYFGNFLNGVATASTVAQTVGGSGTFQNTIPPTAPTANLSAVTFNNTSVGGITLNVPLTQNGALNMINGQVNASPANVFTHIKTGVANNVFIGSGTAAYFTGPFRLTVPASFTNADCVMPVGKTAPNWIAFFNVVTNAGGSVTFQAERNNSISPPNAADGVTITGLTPGAEWVTSIVSGAANLTSFSSQIYEPLIVSGNIQAAIKAPATTFSAFGSGSTFIAGGAPLFNALALNVPPIAGTDFPDRIAIGLTGPLNVTNVVMEQSTVPAVLTGASRGSTNNNLARVIISAVGSSGTVALDDITFTYTGTAPIADITAVSLWTGTFTAPVTQIATTTITGFNEISYTGLNTPIVAGNNYLWLRFNVSASAGLGNTVDVQLNQGDASAWIVTGGATANPPLPAVAQNPTGNVTIDYCRATFSFACSSNDILTAVSFNTLSASPGCPGGTLSLPNNYSLNPATTTVEQGNSYTFNFTTGSGGSQGVGVWIDFNQDGDFNDPGEFFGAVGTTPASSSGSFTVTIDPAALTGVTRMRVLNRWNVAVTAGDVCLTGINYGTTTDFNITITSPSPRALSGITAVQQTGGIVINTTNNNLLRVDLTTTGALGTLTLTQIRFNYTGTSAADIAANGVTLWTGTVSAPTTQIGSAVSLISGNATFTGLSVNLNAVTYLWLRVNSSATATIGNLVDARIVAGDITITAAGGATPPGSQPVADVDPAGSRFIDYCPAGTTSGGTTDAITNVTLVGNTITLNNSSGLAPSPYYTFYNAVNKPDLFRTGTYNISVTMGSDPNQYSGVWFDFNNNGTFEAAEYFSLNSNAGSSGTSIIPFTVPPSAFIGDIRVRVRGGSDNPYTSGQACGILGSPQNWGEVEDYIVTIVPPPNCSTQLPFPATSTTATATTTCSGNLVSFDLTTPMPPATGITYQLRRNNVNLGSPSPNLPITVPVTLSGNYDIVVSCNAVPAVTATPIALTVIAPTVTSTTPATRCGPGTNTLAATPGGGASIRWFNQPTGGTLVGTGNSFVTPNQNPGTITYYAEAFTLFGGGNVGKVNRTEATGFLANNWGIVFSTANGVSINSVEVYTDDVGTIDIAVLNAANTEILSTGSQPITGNGLTGTPVVLPVNLQVPPGSNYKLVVKSSTGLTSLGRDITGNSFPYTHPSNAMTVEAGWNGANTSAYYFFYNINASSICSSPRTAVNSVVTTPPPINLGPLNTNICEGTSVTANVSGSGYTTFNWTANPLLTAGLPPGPGSTKVLSPTATTLYTVTATGGGCNNLRSFTITVRPTPTNPVFNVPPPAGICIGSSINLGVTSTTAPTATVTSWDFDDGTLSGWTASNFGSNPANWFVQSGLYNPSTSVVNFSVNGSPFLVVNSDALGLSASGTANITSPSFSTLGATGLTLNFTHVFRYNGTNAFVQYSVDNGLTWATFLTLSATTPAQTWTPNAILTTTQSVALPAAANNQPNVRIRFSYPHGWDWYWFIDDVNITRAIVNQYRVNSNILAGNVPIAAQSYAPGNNNVTVTPNDGGTIIYTVQVQNTAGCNSLADAVATVNVSNVVLAPSNTGPQRVNTNLTLSSNVTGGFGGYIYQWRKLPDLVTVINTNPNFTIASAPTSASGVYQVTATDGQGCSAVATTDVLVFDAIVWNGSVSSDWYNSQNWTPPIVPADDCDENVAITNSGFAPVFPGPAVNVGNFIVEAGSQITLNSNLRVCRSLGGGSPGTFGTVTGPGSIELTSNTISFVGGRLKLPRLVINKTAGGQVRFQGRLELTELLTVLNNNAPIIVESSGNVLLKSTPSGTAQIGPIPAGTSISTTDPGGFTVERHLPFTVPEGGSNGNWFFIGSPIVGKFFTDWAGDFRIAGTVGSFSDQGPNMISYGNPVHTTIFEYNESLRAGRIDTVQKRGWRIPGLASTIGTGKGYRTWIRRAGSQDYFDNKGMFNYGTVGLPTVTSTQVTPCNNDASDWCFDDDRGWNLVANPLPATIDWEASPANWAKPATMAPFFVRWVNTTGGSGYGQYANGGSWTGILPEPANSRYIPSSQGFFVRLNPTGPTYSENWSISEGAKAVNQSATFVRVASDDDISFKMILTRPTLEDVYGFQNIVKLGEQYKDEFDFNEEVTSLGSNRFYFTMLTDGKAVTLNRINKQTQQHIIPLNMVYYGENGVYKFEFRDIEQLLATHTVFIKDKHMNTIHPVTGAPFEFTVESTNGTSSVDRFELIIFNNTITGSNRIVGTKGLTIYPNPTASGAATTFAISGMKGEVAGIVVVDMMGREVHRASVALDRNGNADYVLEKELAAGVYTVRAKSGNDVLVGKVVVK